MGDFRCEATCLTDVAVKLAALTYVPCLRIEIDAN
jgi:hypothetical protein